jgi:hypothetical protein
LRPAGIELLAGSSDSRFRRLDVEVRQLLSDGLSVGGRGAQPELVPAVSSLIAAQKVGRHMP